MKLFSPEIREICLIFICDSQSIISNFPISCNHSSLARGEKDDRKTKYFDNIRPLLNSIKQSNCIFMIICDNACVHDTHTHTYTCCACVSIESVDNFFRWAVFFFFFSLLEFYVMYTHTRTQICLRTSHSQKDMVHWNCVLVWIDCELKAYYHQRISFFRTRHFKNSDDATWLWTVWVFLSYQRHILSLSLSFILLFFKSFWYAYTIKFRYLFVVVIIVNRKKQLTSWCLIAEQTCACQ